jgi:tRNA U38,U39,U40 pseudouridine synthase TruA
MVEIATGNRPPDDMRALLANEPGLVTSPPAPAAGLFLAKVHYEHDGWKAGETCHEVLP